MLIIFKSVEIVLILYTLKNAGLGCWRECCCFFFFLMLDDCLVRTYATVHKRGLPLFVHTDSYWVSMATSKSGHFIISVLVISVQTQPSF